MRRDSQRIFFIGLIVCLLFSLAGFSQKVKYKNLFPILESKDYLRAEPLLLAYLKDTQDEANPYFFLGEILSGKLDSSIIFPSPVSYDSIADKAVAAYQKAISLVDEREVRKNDEYYMAYNRRDLRTGKFGIKISDIHLDYEKKIASVIAKKEIVAKIHLQKKQIDSSLVLLNKNIANLISRFPGEQSFLFQSGPEDLKSVNLIISGYNDLKEAVKAYVAVVESLNNSLYKPSFEELPLSDWNQIQQQALALDEPEISLAAIDRLLAEKLAKVHNEISPLKALLEQTDKYLNSVILIHQNLSDSAQIKADTIPNFLKKQLGQFNGGALALNVLEYKQQKSEAALLSNKQLFPVLADSANVFQRTKALARYSAKLEEMQSTINFVRKSGNEKILADFAFYFDELNPSFEGYFDTEATVVQKQLANVSNQSLLLEAVNQFFINEEDTIYISRQIVEADSAVNVVDTLIEREEELIIAGQLAEYPFVGKAGFDMQVKQLFKLDTVATLHQVLELKDSFLFISMNPSEGSFIQTLVFLSPQLEQVWEYKFSSPSLAQSAKTEAGIFFIYGADGEVLKTLDSSGKEIGN